jgi:hypothetical protein
MKFREVMTRVGADRMVVESFCDQGGGETKCWEGIYTRAK